MAEKVPVVLQPGQKLVDGTGRECTECRRQLADGEQALYTPRTWPPSYATMERLTCAACYRPPGRPERFTERTSHGRPPTSSRSLTSWSSGGYT